MAEKKQVIFRKKAKQSIEEVSLYVEQNGYPETAEQYAQRMIDFGYSLTIFPNKYPICRFEKFAKRTLHCAAFDKTYIFVYKTVRNQLVIYNIIHGKRLK